MGSVIFPRKQLFKHEADDFGIQIKHYCINNGVFVLDDFCNRMLSFLGIGGDH